MRRKIFITFLCLVAALVPHTQAAGQEYASHSVLAEGNWFRIEISQTGIYRLTTSNASALRGSSIVNIGLYGLPGGTLTETNDSSRPNDLLPMPMEARDANGNGIFDEGDELLFYAEGADKWSYSSSDQRMEHTTNPYATHNYCYLTTTCTSPRRLSTTTAAADPQGTMDSCTVVAVTDNELTNVYQTGSRWMGEKFSPTMTRRSFTMELENLYASCPIKVRYAFLNSSNATAGLKVGCNGSIRSHTLSNYASSRYLTVLEQFSTAGSGTVTIDVTYQPQESTAAGYIDYIELNALVPNRFNGGQLRLFNTRHIGTAETWQFRIGTSRSSLRVWDVTQYDSVAEMSLTAEADGYSFAGKTDRVRSYLLFDGTQYLSPGSMEPVGNQDLHASENADLVIVTHTAYKSQSERLAELHRIVDGMNVRVVTDQEVYNEFASGRQDPMAIRELLRMYAHRAEADSTLPYPRYLLLFGKGSYDNRNLLGENQTPVVTFETAQSYDDEGQSFCSDDYLGYLTDGATAQSPGRLCVGIGRLPAKCAEEANLLVEKIGEYMMRADLQDSTLRGDWRNYVTLLADDADPGKAGDKEFAEDAETLAQGILGRYPAFNIDRIYADAFQQQSGAIGSYYPDVNNALQKRINEGCLLLNYIGHGSVGYIGTERFIEMQDISNYSNQKRLPVVITSTCSYGHYDLPHDVCGAEAFVLADNGAIGCIAAARPISHSEAFNTYLCIQTLTPGVRLGDALRKAKNDRSGVRCITLIGDPALSISLPQERVVVTSINGIAVVEGVNDSAEVLSTVTVEGEIQDASGQRISDFEGTVYPVVLDRVVRCRTLANDNEGTEVDFEQQKNVLHKSQEPVHEGRFSYQFTIPRDVAYDYAASKLSHYAQGCGVDATGQYSRLYLGGFDTNVDLREQRPSIRLYMNDSLFRNGGITSASPTLYAILEDSVGINAVGSGLGHDITAVLDGNPNSVTVLNDFYERDDDNPLRGNVRYTYSKLSEGRHTLTLKAWNIYNYSNSATISFVVRSGETMVLENISVQPNPARGQVRIRAEHNGEDPIQRCVVELYDRNGQQVQVLEPAMGTDSFVTETTWDLRNAAGAEVADGVYVARILLYTEGGDLLTQTAKIVKIK